MKFRQLAAFIMAAAVSLALPRQSVAQTLEFPPPPPEAAQFDFLIGEWTFEAAWKTPSGVIEGEGTWKARAALGGYGITDEWTILDGPGGDPIYVGASTRYYNPHRREWDLRFLNVASGDWNDQHAEWRDGEMHLWWRTPNDGGPDTMMRVRYYDITEDHFRWSGDRSNDGGATWIEGWLTMEVRRTD